MLTYLLAIAVGLGSFGLYMAAFFLPEVHRRYDLVWSGVGLFYALVLWVCAGRITGAVLLGQMASVSLLGWFVWQTLKLRLAETSIDQRTQLPPDAHTPTEVLQTSFSQIRTNLQQSSNRSTAAASLNRSIDRIESNWINFSSWFKALTTTLEPPASSQPSASSQTPSPSPASSQSSPQPFPESFSDLPASPSPPPPPPAPIPPTLDIAALSDTLDQQSLAQNSTTQDPTDQKSDRK